MYSHHQLLFLVPLLYQCVARASCVGDTVNFTGSGKFVPFNNLCGQNISISVDSVDSYTRVKDRTECVRRCVFRKGLCYSYDIAMEPLSHSSDSGKSAPKKKVQDNNVTHRI